MQSVELYTESRKDKISGLFDKNGEASSLCQINETRIFRGDNMYFWMKHCETILDISICTAKNWFADRFHRKFVLGVTNPKSSWKYLSCSYAVLLVCDFPMEHISPQKTFGKHK